MTGCWGLGLRCLIERPEDSLAHLTRCLARKGNSEDLLGRVDLTQQGQVSLDQQPGLTGSRRRLHDKTVRNRQRAVAG